jgi:DNA polymerase III epsilon subunit-like protein
LFVARLSLRSSRHRFLTLVLAGSLQRFGIEVFNRHDAVADALATAQLLLAVLAHAEAKPRRVEELLWDPEATRWLG